MTPPQDEVRSDDKVPDPELSPTTNPLLAQNLGLWAQVYYTTPPEQRDQAVQKLLQELKRGSSPEELASLAKDATTSAAPTTVGTAVPETEQPPAKSPLPGESRLSEEVKARQSAVPPIKTATEERPPESIDNSLVCPACFHKNRPQQRFCGLCGFPLKSTQAPGSDVAAAKRSTPSAAPLPAGSMPRPRQLERSEESWDWLRERNASAFDTSSEHSGTWKYIALVAGLLLIVLVASIWWAGSKKSPPTPAPATAQSASGTAPEPSRPAPTDSAPSVTSASPSQQKSAPESSEATVPQSPVEQAPAKASSAPTNPIQGTAGDDDGTTELTQARRYLDGQGVPRDSRAASFWLWKAVAKKNTTAVLLLSDLYARGDGVSRSCDQARVLLTAAAQRGSADAAAKLASLRQTLCP